MRINFTYNNKNYTICTVKDFAKALLKYLSNTQKPGQTKFVADFAISNILDSDEIDMSHPETIVENVDGWYGVKELGEIGFNNSEDRQLVFEYYGGGCFRSYNINMDYYNDEIFEEISECICRVLDAEEDWIIFVQWTQDECLKKDEEEAARAIQQYEVVEVCPECGAENVMTWDVEKEGYVAYCPHCGSKMMLCDECIHSDDAPICDWNPCNGCCREREKCKKNSKSSK